MEGLVNGRAVAISVVVAITATVAPAAAQAQVTVNADWVGTAPTGTSPRVAPSMAYDLLHRKTILFGGGSTWLSDTWQYDGTSWTQLQVTGPPGRNLAPMLYYSARGVSVLFCRDGGQSGLLSHNSEVDRSTWSRRRTLPPPPPPL